MTIAAAVYVDAIAHLPPGAVLRVDDVPWEEYERLLADLGEGYAVRIFYDRGRLEIMAPTSIHERVKNIINRLGAVLGDELHIDIESLGSTTFKLALKVRGVEPDDCFYVANARHVIGRQDDLDLERDPPPDIVVEIERTSASLEKLPIYAALGVPEVWRVAGREVRMYVLAGDRYEEASISQAFPVLAAETLSRYVAHGFAEGTRSAAQAFRSWLRERA